MLRDRSYHREVDLRRLDFSRRRPTLQMLQRFLTAGCQELNDPDCPATVDEAALAPAGLPLLDVNRLGQLDRISALR